MAKVYVTFANYYFAFTLYTFAIKTKGDVVKFNKNKALEKAKELAGDFNEVKAERFASKNQDKSWYSDFVMLLDILRDKTFRIDSSTYLAIAGALAYVVLPLDLIPDFIPGVGFIDDIFVIGYVLKNLSDEIDRYKKHIMLKIA